jgi:hypothetical protein
MTKATRKQKVENINFFPKVILNSGFRPLTDDEFDDIAYDGEPCGSLCKSGNFDRLGIKWLLRVYVEDLSFYLYLTFNDGDLMYYREYSNQYLDNIDRVDECLKDMFNGVEKADLESTLEANEFSRF